MASLGTPTSQACPKCGTGWKKIGFSFIALFILAGIGSLLLWVQNTGNATRASELENQVKELELDLGLKNLELENAPGPSPFFYDVTDSETGFGSGIIMVDAVTGEETRIISENTKTFAVPKLEFDGVIFTTDGAGDGDVPGLEVSSYEIASNNSELVGVRVWPNPSTNPLSPSETMLITGIEFLDEENQASFAENQILLFDLLTSEVVVLGTYRDGEDIDVAEPVNRFAGLRDIQTKWTSQTCADVRIYSVTNEPVEGGAEGETVAVRTHKEWREFCIK